MSALARSGSPSTNRASAGKKEKNEGKRRKDRRRGEVVKKYLNLEMLSLSLFCCLALWTTTTAEPPSLSLSFAERDVHHYTSSKRKRDYKILLSLSFVGARAQTISGDNQRSLVSLVRACMHIRVRSRFTWRVPVNHSLMLAPELCCMSPRRGWIRDFSACSTRHSSFELDVQPITNSNSIFGAGSENERSDNGDVHVALLRWVMRWGVYSLRVIASAI